MAGISIGFAVWGSVRPEPDLWQGAESMLADEQPAGIRDETAAVPAFPECRADGCRQWAYFVWKGRASGTAYGQHYKDHDLHSCAGAWKSGGFL